MTHDNNDNVNVVSTNNDNDNGKYDRSKKVEAIADKLIHRLAVEVKWRPFFCKVAWKLPEARVWSNYEQALKGNNPAKLFIWLCKRDGV